MRKILFSGIFILLFSFDLNILCFAMNGEEAACTKTVMHAHKIA